MHHAVVIHRSIGNRLSDAATARLSWLLALAITVLGVLAIVLIGEGDSGEKSPVVLPSSAESMRAAALRADFPGGDKAPVIVVLTRADGQVLSATDREVADRVHDRMMRTGTAPGPPIPVTMSQDGMAALIPIPIESNLSGFALNDVVESLRDSVNEQLSTGLVANVTGGPAFGADIANAFTGANVTLLAVTGAVVALLLIVTYRSPVLWLVPLLVIAIADRVAAVLGSEAARLAGLNADGSTSGITSVLVFGAGTNYALLLISRYREELRRTPQHREALSTALRFAGPAILASNATVVLALLTLLLASSPSTRSLGLQAATGLLIALLFVVVVLPPFLAAAGPKLFWPFVPQPGDAETINSDGIWYRVADWVSHHATRVVLAVVMVLGVLATGLVSTPVGLNQIDQFRVQADSVVGYQKLAKHFPAGLTDPVRVIAHRERAEEISAAIKSTQGVVTVAPAGQSRTGLQQWQVVIDAPPASQSAFNSIAALRDSVQRVDSGALVGGSDAQALDARTAASHDRYVVMPAILAVVTAVLYVLLRAALAPLVLVGATVLSALAAMGLGGWISVHIIGFPALDETAPLMAFLFLVALGVDYTIFLVSRAREETPQVGTRLGMVRAVSATGGVITSAGVVLASVFCVLGVLPLIVLTQIGIIVGLGILLDTFVVRTVLIPALFAVIGPRIWWPAAVQP